MARSLPSTVVEALNAQTTDNVFLVLLTVSHPDFTTVRLVNNTEDITSNGNVHSAFPFSIILPPDSEEFQPRIKVEVVNVTKLLIDEIRTIAGDTDRATVDIQVVEASDPDTDLITLTNFQMVEVSYDKDKISFLLVIETFLSEPFPSKSFTPSNFPGLF